jgi:hypothetical protein
MFEDILGSSDKVELSEEEMRVLAEELLVEDCCGTDGCCVSPSHSCEEENTGCAGGCNGCGH